MASLSGSARADGLLALLPLVLEQVLAAGRWTCNPPPPRIAADKPPTRPGACYGGRQLPFERNARSWQLPRPTRYITRPAETRTGGKYYVGKRGRASCRERRWT